MTEEKRPKRTEWRQLNLDGQVPLIQVSKKQELLNVNIAVRKTLIGHHTDGCYCFHGRKARVSRASCLKRSFTAVSDSLGGCRGQIGIGPFDSHWGRSPESVTARPIGSNNSEIKTGPPQRIWAMLLFCSTSCHWALINTAGASRRPELERKAKLVNTAGTLWQIQQWF